MATNIINLTKRDLLKITISSYRRVRIFDFLKDAFYSKITGIETGRPEYNENISNYVGGYIISKKDILKMIGDNNCEGLHVSFGYKEEMIGEVSQKQTHLIFQKILSNATNNNLILDNSKVFSTDPNGGNSPDPVFHCPGPNCNP